MDSLFSTIISVTLLFACMFGFIYLREDQIEQADGYLFDYIVFYPTHNDTITAYTKNDCQGCGTPDIKVSSHDGTNYIYLKGNEINFISNTAPLKVISESIRPTHDKPL